MSIRACVIAAFHEKFGAEPDFVARAPGRVNLLGEHVDYNDGFVLPAAIDRATWVAFRAADSSASRLFALDLGESAAFDSLEVADRRVTGWARYPAGVQWSLGQAGLDAPPLEAAFASDVPRGAGLSSSASVEMAFAAAWQRLGGWELSPLESARLAQRAENEYVGVHCGIMDQFASACGKIDHLLHLDCRSLDWQALPMPASAAIVIADTSVRRSLAGSAYNDRRSACEQAVALLREALPGIRALRDVPLADFQRSQDRLPEMVARRARHVVEEIERTRQAVDCLSRRDLAGFGRLMDDCHLSLRDLYEVSCRELDVMVAIGQGLPGCLGARLTGAGFGGCTVNLVERSLAANFAEELARRYHKATGLTAQTFVCQASGGAAVEPAA